MTGPFKRHEPRPPQCDAVVVTHENIADVWLHLRQTRNVELRATNEETSLVVETPDGYITVGLGQVLAFGPDAVTTHSYTDFYRDWREVK